MSNPHFVDRDSLEIPVEALAIAARLELESAGRSWNREYPPEDNISVSTSTQITESYFRHLAFLNHLLDCSPSLREYLARREREIEVVKSNYGSSSSSNFLIIVTPSNVRIWKTEVPARRTDFENDEALHNPSQVQALLESDQTTWWIRALVRTLAETSEAKLFENLYIGI